MSLVPINCAAHSQRCMVRVRLAARVRAGARVRITDRIKATQNRIECATSPPLPSPPLHYNDSTPVNVALGPHGPEDGTNVLAVSPVIGRRLPGEGTSREGIFTPHPQALQDLHHGYLAV